MTGGRHLNWGLLSTARINRAVIPPIRSSKNSRLRGVASRSLENAAAYAKTWDIPRFYGSYEALLADPDIDVIYISLPNSLHAEWSIKAMQQGKHVLCEKPLATSLEDIDEIMAVATKTGRVITEAFMYRHHPQTRTVKQMIDQGEIGKLQIIRGSFCYTNTRPDNPRLDAALGGGSLWDVGCYPVSYSRYVTGREPAKVYGQQMTGPTGVDLFFSGQLSFPGDVIAQFECSFISPSKAVMEFSGERGRIFISEPYKPGEKTKLLVEQDGRARDISIKGLELYRGEIEDIENAILFGKSPLINLEDSRANVATLEALYHSARTSTVVTVQSNQPTGEPR